MTPSSHCSARFPLREDDISAFNSSSQPSCEVFLNAVIIELIKNIYDILADLNIGYEKYDHQAVFTVKEAEKYNIGIEAGESKNLFLRNKKGDKHFLVIAESTAKVDLKKLSSLLDGQKLSFASPERLQKYLGVTPGSVSPFGLINDESKLIKVLVDKELLKYAKLGYHPNINTSTLVISTDDFKTFLNWTQNAVVYIDL